MKNYLELKNRENLFVAGALFDSDVADKTILAETFESKIEEYDWEANQDYYTAYCILRDVVYFLEGKITIGVIPSKKIEEFLIANWMKTYQPDDKVTITFESRKAEEFYALSDNFISMSCENLIRI